MDKMIDDISKNSIKKLALKGSVGSLSSLVNDEIRREISSVSTEICIRASILCEVRKAQTINHHDVEGAINSIYYIQDMKLGQPPGIKHRNVKSCPDVLNKTFHMKNQDKIRERRIRNSQNMFNCFNIPKSVFKKKMNECVPNKRKSSDALIIFQEAVENHIINVFKHAQQMNVNKTMKSETIKSVINMIKGQHGKVEETHKEKFDVFIRKVLKKIHPDTNISKDTLFQVNAILNLIASKLSSESLKLSRLDKKSTISSRHLELAVKLLLHGLLASHAISSINKNTGLQFSPARAGRFMSNHSGRTTAESKVALASVLEYLCAEITELAGNVTSDKKKVTITTRHLFLAIENDHALYNLINNVIGYKIPLSGVNNYK